MIAVWAYLIDRDSLKDLRGGKTIVMFFETTKSQQGNLTNI